MPLRLDVKKKFTQKTDRVKSVDMHPTEPWVLCALYSGKVAIYNYQTSNTVKSFDVAELPVRCAKFIVRKQWIITGADDMLIRVFNINTQERVTQFEGHQDYIRYLEVHPTQPYVFSSSDDMTVKLWDWEKGWACTQTYEGHAHYVMMVRINPKDTNTFATASLDRSVKVWSLSAPTPNFSLEGHDRGVNCVDYYPGGDKPYIVSGADDNTLRIWDYQTRSCVQALEGHTNNVCAVAFHPRLPVILSGSEDGTFRVWHNTTYRLETTLNYGFERAWAIAVAGSSHKVALGFDEGTIVVKLGREMPVASMDKNGKIVIARNNVIFTTSIRAAVVTEDGEGAASVAAPASVLALADGEPISLPEKELGSVELFPQSIAHNSNGRFVAVVGDNEYVIYTAQALRNKAFGTALDFVWSASGTGDYAVRESTTRIKIFKNFKETLSIRPPIAAEGLYGGTLLCVRSTDSIVFYDWDSERIVRRMEVAAKGVYWNESGELVTITTDEGFYVLQFDRVAYEQGSADSSAVVVEEGVEVAFTVQHEVSEKVRNGTWVGDCFLYTNASSRLNYYVGGEVMTLAHLDRHMYMLGYLAKEGRLYLIDKTGAIVSYGLLLALLEYQTAVVRRDFETANRILPEIPREQHNAIAKFLEGQGFKEQALAVATDPDLKFELSVQLNQLEGAYELLKQVGTDADSVDTQAKWKALMDLALARSDVRLAEECALAGQDAGGLLLLATATGSAQGLQTVAEVAKTEGRTNVTFIALFLQGKVDECVQLLVDAGRVAEAVFFSRTYAPSHVARLMPLWKTDVAKLSRRAAEALADPLTAPDKFPDFSVALLAESKAAELRSRPDAAVPARYYKDARSDLDVDLIAMFKELALQQAAAAQSASSPRKQAGPSSPKERGTNGSAAPKPAPSPRSTDAVAPALAVVASAPVPQAPASASASAPRTVTAVTTAAPIPAPAAPPPQPPTHAIKPAHVSRAVEEEEEEDEEEDAFVDVAEEGGQGAAHQRHASSKPPATSPAQPDKATRLDDFDLEESDWS